MKKAITMAVALMLLLSAAAIPAFALDDTTRLVAPADGSKASTKYVWSDQWTLAYTGVGSAKNLAIANYSNFYLDIRMVDYSGTEVWYQYHTMSPNGTGYYYVGSNVKYVYLMVSDGVGAGYVEITVSPAS